MQFEPQLGDTANGQQKASVMRVLVQARALRDALMFVYQTDQGNIWRFGSYRTFMDQYNALVKELASLTPAAGSLSVFDLSKIKGQFNTIAMAQKSYCDSVLALLSMLISVAEQELGAQEGELSSFIDFLRSRLRPAVFRQPGTEREIQDVVEQLLIGRGCSKGGDYDREVGRVKVSAKEVVPDFTLPKLGMALEVKLLKDASRRSALIDEINADIKAYGKSYGRILFLVYDLGAIRDEAEFKRDLDNQRNVFVVVVKH